MSTRLAAALASRYRIERELGQGGMATVYLASDLRHEREVAIKVLHPDLGAVLGSERFLSEIKTTARLQHPHILPLLDSGEADGLLYYVMPYVRGETLRARLARERQLPLDDALQIAREVADALGAAHALGIIHRDIKPENILLQGGHALVADFGIALAVQHAGGARMTQTGLSLGTPQYMSPEQAMGERAVDARSDIYALGAVTYEMLTGDPPFTGATVQAIIAKALTERPVPPSTVRDTVPPGVEQAVLRALAKLPADRFGSAAEFVAALRDDASVTLADAMTRGRGGAAGTRVLASSRLRVWALVSVAAVAGATGWLLGRSSREAPAAVSTATRFVLDSRPGERTPVIIGKVFALSPDGSTMVYVASMGGRTQQLYRRRFDELESVAIPGTGGATDPAFSPDGKWLAFFTGARLVKLPLEGGTPFELAPVPGAISRGLAWSGNGEILFATNASATLFAVSQDGGRVREVFHAPGSSGLRWPVALPDPDAVLFSSFSPVGDSVFVYAGSLKDGTATRVNAEAYHPLGVLDDKLVYVARNGDVMAAPFDARKRVTTGSGLRVASAVQMSIGTGLAIATLSQGGDLLYRDGATASQLLYGDAKGAIRPAVADTMGFQSPRFSPDGRRVVVSVETANRRTIWMLDRASGILSKFAGDEIATARDRPEWSPDGRRVFYRLQAPSGNSIVMRPVDGGSETPVPTPRTAVNELVMAPDGATVLARVSSGVASSQDLWSWKLPDTVALRFTDNLEFETGGRFSPDGRWVAYSSETGGIREVFVSPFPGPGGRIQVSTGGGGLPVWSRDGRTLYFPQANRMLATTLAFVPEPAVTGRRILFEGDYALDDALHSPFDVGPDGTFLLVRPVREVRTVVIRGFRTEMRNQLAKQGGK
ncbi:MAG TPA: protein kinase [Gemmatimonadales bacterium]|nr:protein kinase [Gemmatimonadales bacterium]